MFGFAINNVLDPRIPPFRRSVLVYTYNHTRTVSSLFEHNETCVGQTNQQTCRHIELLFAAKKPFKILPEHYLHIYFLSVFLILFCEQIYILVVPQGPDCLPFPTVRYF